MAGAPIELSVDGPHGPRAVRVSNPERVYFAELSVTKLDVVRYFLSVGDGILRALRERPTTLERWPAGVFPGAKLAIWQGEPGDAFFQKRIPKNAPGWVERAEIAYPEGSHAAGIYPSEIAVVAWAANL